MSSFIQLTKHPKTGQFEAAAWIGDCYGPHRYGVRFIDGSQYEADKTVLKTMEGAVEYSWYDFFPPAPEQVSAQVETQVKPNAMTGVEEWEKKFDALFLARSGEMMGYKIPAIDVKFFIRTLLTAERERNAKIVESCGFTSKFEEAASRIRKDSLPN
jgi:hypothetical protein